MGWSKALQGGGDPALGVLGSSLGKGEQNLCWEQFSATGGDWVGTCTVNFGLLRQAELLQVNSPLHTTQDILDPNRGELSHSHQRTLGSPLPHSLLQQLLSQTPTP